MSEIRARGPLAKYVKTIAGALGLDGWTFVITDELPDAVGNFAVCTPVYQIRSAEIDLRTDWREWPDYHLREVIVHELLHCVLSPLERPLQAVGQILDEAVLMVSLAHMENYIEDVTNGLEKVISPSLPLPEPTDQPS